MCGIAGIIYKDGEHPIGSEMTRMLQSMKHRGPDSTGYALYGQPSNLVIMRYKLADANTPRDFEYEDRLRRHSAEVERRLAALGAQVKELEEETEYAFRVTLAYDGDLKRLADFVEDVPDVEVLSLGHSLEIGKVPRRRRDGRGRLPPERLQRHPRDRPRPHGDGVRRRHLGRAPLLGVPTRSPSNRASSSRRRATKR